MSSDQEGEAGPDVVGPGGIRVVAASGTPDKNKLPAFSGECRVMCDEEMEAEEPKIGFLAGFFSIVSRQKKPEKSYACGHKGPPIFGLIIYGEVIKTTEKQEDYCPDCALRVLKNKTIFCCLCGLPIQPVGHPVALYDSESADVVKSKATFLDERTVIGCMRWNCCPTGGFFAGHWTEDGFKPAFR